MIMIDQMLLLLCSYAWNSLKTQLYFKIVAHISHRTLLDFYFFLNIIHASLDSQNLTGPIHYPRQQQE